MQIFNNLNKYRRTPSSCSNVEEISLNRNDDIKKGRWSKIKDSFQAGAGCLGVLLLFCSPFILPEEALLFIGIVAFVFGVLPHLLALFGLPFLLASGITKGKLKIFIVGLVIILFSVLVISLYGNLKGEKAYDNFEYEYLDSHRPDKW